MGRVKMTPPSKEILYDLYIVQKKSMKKIAKELNMSPTTVFNYLNRYGIETRDNKSTFNFKGGKHTSEELEKISQTHKGKILSDETKQKIRESHTVKGVGHKKTRADGYIAIYFPDHPKSNKDGYIMEHDLIMECYIGRWLNGDEVVHHINGIRNDNRIENLKLMTIKEHASYHMTERQNKRRNVLLTR